MINFCDKEVYVMYEKELNRSSLFSFFCDNHTTDIVLVKDYQEEVIGIVTYERLLYAKENLVQKQRLQIGEDIWGNAYTIFKEDKNIVYIPVFDTNNELVYFCHQSTVIREFIIDSIIKELIEERELLFINEIYPKIKVVYIHDLNEIAYKFYRLLIARNIPVVLVGKQWGIIMGIKTEIKMEMLEVPSFSQMNVYANGTPLMNEDRQFTDRYRFSVPDIWEFLYEIGRLNHLLYEDRLIQEYKKRGIKLFSCHFPMYQELSKHFIEEEYRNLKCIYLLNDNLDTKRELIRDQIKKIYHMEYEEIIGEIEKKKSNRSGNVKYGTGENIIYVVGPCIIDAKDFLIRDELTYQLYEALGEEYKGRYSIKGIVVPEHLCNNLKNALESLSIRENDIVIVINQSLLHLRKKFNLPLNTDLFLKDLFDTRTAEETWFMNVPIHTTGAGNKVIAKEIIAKLVEPEIEKIDFKKEHLLQQRGRAILTDKEQTDLQQYIQDIKQLKYTEEKEAKIGSIVMNCNPLTLGHMHLIEYASRKMDILYIFIVEEDKSYFKFKDRYELVKKAVEYLRNVRVIPSGRFILSNKTLPAYFTKDYDKNQIIDASGDISIFAEYIAPALNIHTRFVGEEPLDYITNQYNAEMKRTLTDYGIEFIIIPRKEMSGEVVSASKVRRLLAEKNFDEIKKIVPDVTYEFLCRREADL